MLRDIARDFGVTVRFGLQPNASPSSRRGGEIEQDRPFAVPGNAERFVDGCFPRNGHQTSLPGAPFVEPCEVRERTPVKAPAARPTCF